MYVVTGMYNVKPGMRDAFVKAIYDQGILSAFLKEEGNISYEYFFPYENPDGVFFVERWTNLDSWEAHKVSPDTIKLQAIKGDFTTGFTPYFHGELIE